MILGKKLLLTATLLLAAGPAGATTFFEGVGYNLTGQYTSADKTSAHFILDITGINGPGDLEGGRYGLNAYGFLLPAGFLSASSPGFDLVTGGLNSNGCNGSGNFFCFSDQAPKPSTVLAANSSLQFEFDLFLMAGFTLDNYNDSFKIDWLGTKHNYNLISQHLGVTDGITPFAVSEVPIPGAIWLFLTGLAGLIALGRKKLSARVGEAVEPAMA